MTQIARIMVGLGLALAATTTDASAQYRGGCRGSGVSCEELRYYCSQGRETPRTIRPFCGGGGGYERRGYRERDDDYRGGGEYGYEYRERGRPLSGRELRYYCSLGDQTPASVRAECVRSGLW